MKTLPATIKLFQLACLLGMLLLVSGNTVLAQCSGCGSTTSSNSNITFTANNQTICLTTGTSFTNYTQTVSFNNYSNTTLCVGPGVTFAGTVNQSGTGNTIINRGTWTASLNMGNSQTFNNYGSFSNSSLTLNNGNTFNNYGTFNLSGQITMNGGSVFTSSGVSSVVTVGNIQLANSATFTCNSPATINGDIQLNNNTTITLGGNTVLAADKNVTLNGGIMNVNSSLTLQGTGNFNNNNGGTLNLKGSISVGGSFTNSSNSTINVLTPTSGVCVSVCSGGTMSISGTVNGTLNSCKASSGTTTIASAPTCQPTNFSVSYSSGTVTGTFKTCTAPSYLVLKRYNAAVTDFPPTGTYFPVDSTYKTSTIVARITGIANNTFTNFTDTKPGCGTVYYAVVSTTDMTSSCININTTSAPSQSTAAATATTAGTLSGTAAVCANGTTTLTLSGYVGNIVQWESSDDNGTTFGSIGNAKSATYSTPGLATTKVYRVAVNSGPGCSNLYSNTLTITQIVSAPSTPTAIVKASGTECANQTSTYTTSSNNATSYTWTLSGGGTISGTGSTGTVVWASNASGTYTITVKGVNCNGNSSTVSYNATVTPAVGTPTAPSGTTSRCIGSGTSAYTTSATSNATSYTWAVTGTGNSISGTGTTGTVTWGSSFTGTATVSVTANGCSGSSSTISTNVTVNTLPTTPTISGTNTICSGNSTTLSTTYTLGTNEAYLWSTGATTSSISVNTAGTYTLQIRNTATACTSAASTGITVTVNPLPGTPTITVGGATTFCSGGSVTLTSSAGSAYLWSNGQTTSSISVTTAGTYTVQTISNGCTSASSLSIPVTVNTTPGSPSISAAGSTTFCSGGNVVINGPAAGTYAELSTLAGSGTAGSANATGTSASFNNPHGLATDASGNVFVAEFNNNLIRKITPAGVVSTFAGSGTAGSTDATGTSASFNHPSGLAFDASGNLFVADGGNHLIRKITSAGVVTTFAGTSGSAGSTNATGTAAKFNYPFRLAFDPSGNLFVGELGNHLVRKITTGAVVTTYAGTAGTSGNTNGTGTAAKFNQPIGVATDASGNVYVADFGNNLIRKISTSQVVTTFAGSGSAGSTNGTGVAASFNLPNNVATDASGNIYVADATNNLIRKITSGGVVSTLAGNGTAGSTNGTGTLASFKYPTGLCTDASGNVYVSETNGNMVRKISQNTTTYLWSNGATTQNLTVSASGSYTLQTINGSCTSAASNAVSVTVNPLPSTPTISGTNTICSGNSTTLSTSYTLGTNEAYLWSTGATTSSISVSTAGTYTLQIRNTATACTSAASTGITVTVNPLPTTPTISGTNTICSGNSTTLSTTYTLGTNEAYLWSTGATTSSILVSTAGTYTLQIRNTATACTSAASTGITVTVNPLPTTPTISGTNTICSGNSTTLSTSYTLGTNEAYLWSTGATTSSISVSTAGTYTLQIRSTATGCTSLAGSKTVVVNSLPTVPTFSQANGAEACAGTLLSITNTAGCPSCTYLWADGTTNSNVAIGLGTNNYQVTVTNSNGCQASTVSVTVTGLATGTWLGLTTDWSTASNWCGGVPTSSTDVNIRSTVTNLPTTLSGTAVCKNLVLPTGSTLNIAAGGILQLYGDISNGTVAGVCGSSLHLLGSSKQTLNATSIGNLVVNNTANVALAGTLQVCNSITFSNGSIDATTYPVVFLATATNPTETATARITGRAIAKGRYVGTGTLNFLGVSIATGADNLDTVYLERRDETASFLSNTGIGQVWTIKPHYQPSGTRGVSLNWLSINNNGKTMTATQVWRKPEGSSTWKKVGSIQDVSSATGSHNISVTTTGFSDWTTSDEFNPLPVTLVSFTGINHKKSNTLTWTTASEHNNNGFYVERSNDGKNFNKIGFVKSENPNSSTYKTYSFIDSLPKTGISQAWYRLTQTDLDGQTETFTPILVKTVGNEIVGTLASIYPNPVADVANLMIEMSNTETLEVQIYSLTGELVHTQTLSLEKGMQSVAINAGMLKTGIYNVKLVSEGNLNNIKLIKQ